MYYIFLITMSKQTEKGEQQNIRQMSIFVNYIQNFVIYRIILVIYARFMANIKGYGIDISAISFLYNICVLYVSFYM